MIHAGIPNALPQKHHDNEVPILLLLLYIPKGPSTEIVEFGSQNPCSKWFLDLQTLLFGYLDI